MRGTLESLWGGGGKRGGSEKQPHLQGCWGKLGAQLGREGLVVKGLAGVAYSESSAPLTVHLWSEGGVANSDPSFLRKGGGETTTDKG